MIEVLEINYEQLKIKCMILVVHLEQQNNISIRNNTPVIPATQELGMV
jgi:hypothetical protein